MCVALWLIMHKDRLVFPSVRFGVFSGYVQKMVLCRGAQSLGDGLLGRLNFVWWHLLFVSPKYGTCFISPIWRLEF
jgi:hypothetical protein